MSRDELLAHLRRIADRQREASGRGRLSDNEVDHIDADDYLLQFIDDPEITHAFYEIDRWYA